MGGFRRYLVRSWLAQVVALPLGCLIGGFITGFFRLAFPALAPEPLSEAFAFGVLLTIFAMPVAALPALLYGAPLYALLASRGHASFVTACLVGAPVALLAWGDPAAMAMLGGFGVSIAGVTHLLVGVWPGMRGHGANNSFKPTPLRGAA